MDCELFKHKLLLRSVLPASLDSSFKCLRFNVIDSKKAASSLYTVVEAICWKVSRKTNISCFCTTLSGLTICLIYHIAQGNILDYAVAELQRRLHVELDSSMEQNVSSSALLVPAVESTMISAMLNQGWSFLENGVILNCNIAAVEEEQSLEAVSVSLQVERDNSICCILAPDVIRIFRLKIFNQLPLEKKQEFDVGKEVNMEEWSWGFNNDEQERCFVLPFLVEGFVIGLCKLPPKAKDYKELIKLWKNKHGLHLSQDCYYVKVEYTYEEESHKHWFPSTIVIRRCGLKPVLQTIRSIKVVKAYESFRSSISGWNFFDLGPLEFQVTNVINQSLKVASWFRAKDLFKESCSRHISEESIETVDRVDCNLNHYFLNLGRKIGTPVKPSENNPILNRSQEAKLLGKSMAPGSHTRKATKGEKSARETVRQLQQGMDTFKKESIGTDSSTRTAMAVSPKRNSKKTQECSVDRVGKSQDLLKNLASGKNETAKSTLEYLVPVSQDTENLVKCKLDNKLEHVPPPGSLFFPLKNSNYQGKENFRMDNDSSGLHSATETPAESVRKKAKSEKKVEKAEHSVVTDINNPGAAKPPKVKKQSTGPMDPIELGKKVRNCHSNGKMNLLTVPELKSFLNLNKSKVGGRKEELIQRIVSLLST